MLDKNLSGDYSIVVRSRLFMHGSWLGKDKFLITRPIIRRYSSRWFIKFSCHLIKTWCCMNVLFWPIRDSYSLAIGGTHLIQILFIGSLAILSLAIYSWPSYRWKSPVQFILELEIFIYLELEIFYPEIFTWQLVWYSIHMAIWNSLIRLVLALMVNKSQRRWVFVFIDIGNTSLYLEKGAPNSGLKIRESSQAWIFYNLT